MATVMISYRREDSWALAGRVADRLGRAFGPAQVFMDVDDIPPGADFAAALRATVDRCNAMVVIIGREWLSVTDASGRRRLDDPQDWVRIEVEAALRRGIPVVPFVMAGARLPAAYELPPCLQGLAQRNAIVTDEAHFDADLERLLAVLPSHPSTDSTASAARTSRLPSLRAVLTLAAALALVAVGWLGWQRHERAQEIDDRVRTARSQADSGDYAGAWKTVQQALAVDRRSAVALSAAGDLGMRWLRNVVVYENRATGGAPGPQRFGEVVDEVAPWLHLVSAHASARIAADCQAHLGWGNALKQRDGVVGLAITNAYAKALEVDPQNPFAHAMWGFWLVERNALKEAREHFAAALAADREREFVRRLQLASLRDRRDAEATQELLRVINAIRAGGESLSRESREQLHNRLYFLGAQELRDALETVLAPADHLRTLEWLSEGLPVQDRDNHQFFLARLRELTGACPQALPLFLKLVGSSSRYGDEALAAIGRCESQPGNAGAALRLVESFVDSPDPDTRQAAVSALPRLGGPVERALPLLARRLGDTNTDVSFAAAKALATFGEPAVPVLVTALRSPQATTLLHACMAVSEIGEPAQAAVPGLAALLRHANGEVSAAAFNALAEFGPLAAAAVPELIRALTTASSDDRQRAAYVLGTIGPAASASAPGLVALLADRRDDEAGFRAAVAAAALGKVRPPAKLAVPPLVAALKDDRERVPVAASEALANLGADAQSAIPALIAALHDTEKEHRPDRADDLLRVVEALAELKDRRHAPAVAAVLAAFEEEDFPPSRIGPVRQALEALRAAPASP